MSAALTIAARDLRARLRDRSALLVAFVAPVMLAVILSSALSGVSSFTTTLAVADLDGGPVAEAFVDQALGSAALQSVVTVRTVADDAAVRAALEDGTAGAGYVIPPGFSSAATSGRSTSLTVVRHPDAQLSGDVAEAIATAFTARLEAQTRAVAATVEQGADLRQLPQIIAAAGRQEPALTLSAIDFAASQANAASYFGPSMAVFFVFFVVALGPASIVRERRQRTLARLHAAPISPWSILLGKSLSVLALAAASFAVMWAVTTLVFGATWGDPLGVAVLSLAVVLAATGVTALIATFARTDQQVDGWTSIVVFTFALLGGNFSNLSDLPPALQEISKLTPNGWAMRGYVDLASGLQLSDVLVPVGAVAAIAGGTLALAALRAKRLVRP
jgi:ABC-2 type transport system permease protein